MRAPDYWKGHYVSTTDPAEIALALRHAPPSTDGEGLGLIDFLSALDDPNVLNRKALAGMPTSSPSWHFGVHQWGFNVFVIEPPSRRSAIHPAIQVDDSAYWMLSQQRQPTALWLVLRNGAHRKDLTSVV